MAHIPPLDIGTQGTEQHEDMQVDRGLYNITITSNFNKNVKMTDLVKEQKRDGSILSQDGFHLTKKGGEWVAREISQVIKNQHNTAKTSRPNQRRTPPPPNPPRKMRRPAGARKTGRLAGAGHHHHHHR